MAAHPGKPCPSDGTDDAWGFVTPYPTVMDHATPRLTQQLREGFHALRWIGRTGRRLGAWRTDGNEAGQPPGLSVRGTPSPSRRPSMSSDRACIPFLGVSSLARR